MSQVTYSRASLSQHERWTKKKWQAEEVETKTLWGRRYTHYHYTRVPSVMGKVVSFISNRKPFDRWVFNSENTEDILHQDYLLLNLNLKDKKEVANYLEKIKKEGKTIKKVGKHSYATLIGPASGLSYVIFIPRSNFKKAEVANLFDSKTGVPLDKKELLEYGRSLCLSQTERLPNAFNIKTIKMKDTEEIELSGCDTDNDL